MNTSLHNSSESEMACVPTSKLARSWRERLRLTAQIIAIPTVLFGIHFFRMVTYSAVGVPDVFHVIEKSTPAPGRYSISVKTDPNKNGGTLMVVRAYPKWLFDRVRLGDSFHSGFCHIRVTRNGRLTALYIPWHRIFPLGCVPLVYCLPAILWFSRVSWFRSLPAIIITLAIELLFVSTLGWVIFNSIDT